MKHLKSILFVVIALMVSPLWAQWDGTALPWEHGTGTQQDPYRIENANQLAFLAEMVSGGVNTYTGKYFVQTADIDLSNQSWLPIGNEEHPFKGHFDGGGHRIDSMMVDNNTYQYKGLFGYVENGSIKNVICFGTIPSGAYVANLRKHHAILIAYANNEIISGCCSEGYLSYGLGVDYIAGVVALVIGTSHINHCFNYAELSGNYAYNSGGETFMGGVIGGFDDDIVLYCCGNKSNIHITVGSSKYYKLYIGGVAGGVRLASLTNHYGCFHKCFNTGDIIVDGGMSFLSTNNSSCYVGGITGFNTYSTYISSYISCYNTGDITINHTNATTDQSNCYGIGNTRVDNISKVWNSYNTGSLSANNVYGISPTSSNSYYREDCGATQGGISRTEASMKSVSFPIVLNADSTVFIMDTQNINGGYPIFCPESYDITVTTQPEDGGVITGAGSYFEGTSCTLEAVANENYVFKNWMENGVIVSTDATYTFTVDRSRELVANFRNDSYYWDVDMFLYPNNMSVTGVIQIEGDEQFTDELELGAFHGEECRGHARPSFAPINNRYLISMTIYGENNDEITFRLYNHETEEEIELPCSTIMIFTADNIIGNAINPYVFNFADPVVEHVTILNKNWNWYSTYIEINGISGLEMLEEALGDNCSMITSQTAFTSYYQSYGWYGSLTSIANEYTYRLNMTNPATIVLTGENADPSQHPITINNGWNYIGFISSANMSVSEAFSGFQPQEGDMVKSQVSFAIYYNGYGWYGALNTIAPGTGLMYKSSNYTSVTFTYPIGSKGATPVNFTTENNHWVSDMHKYANNMTMMAVVKIDNQEIASDDYELAVFADDGCHGSVKLLYVEPIDRYVAFLTITGAENEELYFGLYDKTAGSEYFNTDERIIFNSDKIIGELSKPFVVRFKDDKVVNNSVCVYPNPVKSGETIHIDIQEESEVEIINALGQVISVETLNYGDNTIKTPILSGIYMFRIKTADSNVSCHRIVLQ